MSLLLPPYHLQYTTSGSSKTGESQSILKIATFEQMVMEKGEKYTMHIYMASRKYSSQVYDSLPFHWCCTSINRICPKDT